MAIKIIPISANWAIEMISWVYDPPYDVYNFQLDSADVSQADQMAETLDYLLDPTNNFYVLIDENRGEMIAFCSFGEDGQVGGGNYELEALDVGFGLRPDLTGQGLGGQHLAQVLTFAEQKFRPTYLRATLAAFNKRVQKVCEKLGFEAVSTFEANHSQAEFVIVLKEVGQ